MTKLPRNYSPLISLEKTILYKNELNKYILDTLQKNLNLFYIETPVIGVKKNEYKSDNENARTTINFDISASSEIFEIFQSPDKWMINFINKNDFINKYNGIITEYRKINRDIYEDTNVSSFIENNTSVELFLDEESYTYNHFETYVEKTFKTLTKIEGKLYRISDKKSKKVLPDEYKIYDWTILKDQNKHLSDEDIFISKTKKDGIIFVYNGIQSELAEDFGWERNPDLNNHELTGSFIAYNEYSKEIYSIATVTFRVDRKTLNDQVEQSGKNFLLDREINKLILAKKFPLTVNIEYHKDKLYIFLMTKCHISEVQARIWTKDQEKKFYKALIEYI